MRVSLYLASANLEVHLGNPGLNLFSPIPPLISKEQMHAILILASNSFSMTVTATP
jgi:hypothetical protein